MKKRNIQEFRPSYYRASDEVADPPLTIRGFKFIGAYNE